MLNQRQIKFINAYISNGGNATKAYMEAGYDVKSKAGARVSACKLLSSHSVQEYIEQRQRQILMSSQITIEAKRNALWQIAQQALNGDEGKPSDYKAAVNSIHELNVMDGHVQTGRSRINRGGYIFNQCFESQEPAFEFSWLTDDKTESQTDDETELLTDDETEH